jgi:DNA-binding response OmpR family regulator
MPASSAVLAKSSDSDSQLLLGLRPSENGVILLIEDDEHIAGLITLILGRVNRRVLRARDCETGRQLFNDHRPSIDLVIVDSMLPDGEGGQLCQQLRAERPHLPVLLTSGREHARVAALIKGGATAFLPKPFLPADVERNVAGLLGV